MLAFAVQVQGVHDVLSTHPGDLKAIFTARMATALLRDPKIKGMRGIETASGLSRDSVFTYLPQEHETSYGLLYCVDRGSENSYDDQRSGQYVVIGNPSNALVTGVTTDTSKYLSSSQESLTSQEQGVLPTADVLAQGRERLKDPRVWEVMNPERDMWAHRSSLAEPLDYQPLGHRVWALAFLLGAADVTLTFTQVRELLGLSERQSRNLVVQLEEAGLAQRRRGRETLVDFLFATVLLDSSSVSFFYEADRAERAHAKQERHHRERQVLASRRTRHGREAWLLIRHPHPGWSPETLAFHSPANELKLAAMFEKTMTRRLALAA